jgi:hypothetical protein
MHRKPTGLKKRMRNGWGETMPKTRSEIKRVLDRKRIAEMMLQHCKKIEIAAELGISPQTVTRDLHGMMLEWRREMLSDITMHKAAELERLALLERQLWDAWEGSKGDSRRHQQWVLPGVPSQDEPAPKPILLRASLVTENSCGDPRFIKMILEISQERSKLLGLYERISLDIVTGTEDDPATMTVEERTRRCLEMLRSVTGELS